MSVIYTSVDQLIGNTPLSHSKTGIPKSFRFCERQGGKGNDRGGRKSGKIKTRFCNH